MRYITPFILEVKIENMNNNFTAANIFPGAVVPWGMAAISPRNTIEKTAPGFGNIPGGYCIRWKLNI